MNLLCLRKRGKLSLVLLLLLIPGDVPRFILRLRSGDEPLRTAQALISAFSALG